MKDRFIIALDNLNSKGSDELITSLEGKATYLKVGMEAYYKLGNDFVRDLKKNFKVFLDLKLHDIPNTVEKALENLVDLEVDMVNIHAQGGLEMMKRAANVVSGSKTKLIAVTVLTSLDQGDIGKITGTDLNLSEYALNLARLTKEAGCHGVVCSPYEARGIKDICGDNFLTVTPGIRLDSNHGDQKRVMTPKLALESGSDYLVIGRSITQSDKPGETFNKMYEEIKNDL